MADEPPRPVTAYAPAHASTIFEPGARSGDHERRGSRGAGICLACGARARATLDPDGEPGVQVKRGTRGDARVTEHALRLLAPSVPGALTLTIEEGAPEARGLGVSGAGVLSACLATAKLLGMGRSDALRAAHRAEVIHRTGLGDVVAQAEGGVVLRTAPGLPPYGRTTRITAEGDIVLLLFEGEVSTREVLGDADRMARVRKAAQGTLPGLFAAPNLEGVLDAGWRFTEEAGLVDDEVRSAVEAARDLGRATVGHLGRTVVAYGDPDDLVDVLQGWGEPVVVPISIPGAHVLPAEIDPEAGPGGPDPMEG